MMPDIFVVIFLFFSFGAVRAETQVAGAGERFDPFPSVARPQCLISRSGRILTSTKKKQKTKNTKKKQKRNRVQSNSNDVTRVAIPRGTKAKRDVLERPRKAYLDELLVFLFDCLEKSFEFGHFRLATGAVGLQIGQFGRKRLVQSPLAFQILALALHLLCSAGDDQKSTKETHQPTSDQQSATSTSKKKGATPPAVTSWRLKSRTTFVGSSVLQVGRAEDKATPPIGPSRRHYQSDDQ